MKFILAKKEQMTQVFTDSGRALPVTILQAGPVVVVQVKNKDRDSYSALQVGFGSRKRKKVSKAVQGHLKDLDTFAHLKEFRLSEEEAKKYQREKTISVSVFSPGDLIEVSAISKGKGFQGVVKRHGFSGGSRTHGQKHSEREPGSIGGGLRTRVPKGMRMAGRMGGERVTVKNLEVVQVLPEKNQILVSGAVPGRRGTLVEIRSKDQLSESQS